MIKIPLSVPIKNEGFKKLFNRKEILAGILIGLIPEFENLKPSEVIEQIKDIGDGAYDIGGFFGLEDNQKSQYVVAVDVLINNKVEEVNLYFDLELQQDVNDDYPLSNFTTSQVQNVVTAQTQDLLMGRCKNFGRSAWIAMRDVQDEDMDSVLVFSSQITNRGPSQEVFGELSDLVKVQYIPLTKDYDWDENDCIVVKFLQSIFNNRLDDSRFNPFVNPTAELKNEIAGMNAVLRQRNNGAEHKSK